MRKEQRDIRLVIQGHLLIKHGPKTYKNQDAFNKDFRRLERLWKRDKERFNKELGI